MTEEERKEEMQKEMERNKEMQRKKEIEEMQRKKEIENKRWWYEFWAEILLFICLWVLFGGILYIPYVHNILIKLEKFINIEEGVIKDFWGKFLVSLIISVIITFIVWLADGFQPLAKQTYPDEK